MQTIRCRRRIRCHFLRCAIPINHNTPHAPTGRRCAASGDADASPLARSDGGAVRSGGLMRVGTPSRLRRPSHVSARLPASSINPADAWHAAQNGVYAGTPVPPRKVGCRAPGYGKKPVGRLASETPAGKRTPISRSLKTVLLTT